ADRARRIGPSGTAASSSAGSSGGSTNAGPINIRARSTDVGATGGSTHAGAASAKVGSTDVGPTSATGTTHAGPTSATGGRTPTVPISISRVSTHGARAKATSRNSGHHRKALAASTGARR